MHTHIHNTHTYSCVYVHTPCFNHKPHILTPSPLTPSHHTPSSLTPSSLTPSPLTPSPLSQIQQLLYLMQSGVVTNSIESLIIAWPKEGETSILLSPPSRDMKRLSMRRKSAMMGGGKCNCGKCLKCIPSPSGVYVCVCGGGGYMCDTGFCD